MAYKFELVNSEVDPSTEFGQLVLQTRIGEMSRDEFVVAYGDLRAKYYANSDDEQNTASLTPQIG